MRTNARSKPCDVLKPPAARWAVIVATLMLWSGISYAHKFGGPNDPCERKVGASLIHITLYQPQFDPDGEYCDEVPRAGNTVFVLDTLGDDLRRVPIGVQFFLSDKSDRPRAPLLILAPTTYRRGVVDTEINLRTGERYIVKVFLERDQNPLVYSFPIRVRAWYRPLVMPALLMLGVLGLLAISVIRYRLSIRMHSSRVIFLTIAPLLLGIVASGCDHTQHAAAALPDTRLVDDRGHEVDLASLHGKVVLLDFVHVGCPGVCDTLIDKFGQIADLIRPELGKLIVLVTVTNDPIHDHPEQLLKLAQSMQADMGGWLFLTGNVQDVDRVVTAFGVDNRPLPDGSPNHVTRVFLLGQNLHQQREFAGMAMNSRMVATELMERISSSGAWSESQFARSETDGWLIGAKDRHSAPTRYCTSRTQSH